MTTKLDTVQNGKGSKLRKSTNLKAYRDADIWNHISKNKKCPSESKNIKN